VRLGFAIAINIDPEILLVDEILAVGDAAFQQKCMDKFADFRQAGKTVVIVSHAMGSLRTMCDHAAWLQKGHLIEVGPTAQTVDDYVDATHVEREQVTVTDNASRWGSGEATISEVELINAAGARTSTFRTGDRFTIRIRFSCTERVDKPVFGLAMTTLDGFYLWAFHSRDGELVPDSINGTGSIDVTVPELMLQPGTFELTASIVDYSTTHTFDFLRNCTRFDVEIGHPRESGGPVALGASWGNLKQGGPAEVAGTQAKGTS
jgi:ABC-2 type transport system ATP-binding protein